MKKVKLILGTLFFLTLAFTADATIVVMGGAVSVETDGTTTKIICGNDPASVCAVVDAKTARFAVIEPSGLAPFKATKYRIERNNNGTSTIFATLAL